MKLSDFKTETRIPWSEIEKMPTEMYNEFLKQYTLKIEPEGVQPEQLEKFLKNYE